MVDSVSAPAPAPLGIIQASLTTVNVVSVMILVPFLMFLPMVTALCKEVCRKLGYGTGVNTDGLGLSAWESKGAYLGRGGVGTDVISSIAEITFILNLALLGYANTFAKSVDDSELAMLALAQVSAAVVIAWYRQTSTLTQFVKTAVQAASILVVAITIWQKARGFTGKNVILPLSLTAILIVIAQAVSLVCIAADITQLRRIQTGGIVTRNASLAASLYLESTGRLGFRAAILTSDAELLSIRVHRILFASNLVGQTDWLNPLLVGFFVRNRDLLGLNSKTRSYLFMWYVLWHVVCLVLQAATITTENAFFNVMVYFSGQTAVNGIVAVVGGRELPKCLREKFGLKEACDTLAVGLKRDTHGEPETGNPEGLIQPYIANVSEGDVVLKLFRLAPTIIQESFGDCSSDLTMSDLLTRARKVYESTPGRAERFCKIELNKFLAWYVTGLGIMERLRTAS